MAKDLNSLEQAIILEIAEANKEKYPFIANHLPFLKVKSRENTGVGMYVNFCYFPEDMKISEANQVNGIPSVNKIVKLDTLVDGLGFTLDIANGKLNFLEFFTYGDESWDGNYGSFRLIDI